MGSHRALLIGAGGMGRTWAKNLRESTQVDLVGWIDIVPDQAAKAAEELEIGGLWTGTDLDQGLTELKPDFVVDVTPPESHHDVTIRSMAAGCAVLGEKPMADSMEHARMAVEAADRYGKLYMVSQSRRYEPRLQGYRRLIKDHLGAIQYLSADFFLGPHFGGFREEMDYPLLLDMAIHTFDAARFLTGADAMSVYCESFNPANSWYKGDASAEALFAMSDGSRYSYRGSWCAEGRNTSWESEWRAVGANGSATWDGDSDLRADVVVGSGGFFYPTKPVNGKPDPDAIPHIAGSLRDFVNALETGSTPMGECHDNIQSLAMVFAAIESAESGRRVDVQRLVSG